MSTNYYQRINICEHCNRYDEIHLGKSSSGWTFGFHGERRSDPELYPMGIVLTFDDWKARLKDAKIFNENNEEVSLDKLLELIKSKKNEKLNHTIYCREHEPKYAARDCWLDKDGNSFSEGEFS